MSASRPSASLSGRERLEVDADCPSSSGAGVPSRWWWAALGLATLGGGVGRLWPRSALWLDEAQSVAFARLPWQQIPGALSTDGAPPLYYLLLHGWMELFGRSDAAVRSLSVVCSLGALAALGVAARRLGGDRYAVIAVALLATNPFAIRYATEGRMYALVVLEVCAGLIVLPGAVERPTPGRLIALALTAAALLYTHYWAIYLLGAVGLLLAGALVRTWRRGQPISRWLRLCGAMAAGGVLWLPWLPDFRFQAARTATPWAHPPEPWKVFDILFIQAGGHSRSAIFLGIVFIAAIVISQIGVTALALLPGFARTRLVRPGQVRWIGKLGVATALTAMLAVAGAIRSGSAFAGRYTSVVLPLLVLLVAAGLARLRSVAVLGLLAVVMATLSGSLVVREIRSTRTPARHIAALLAERASPGDIVVFCPDQLGPATSRELESTNAAELVMGVYPTWASPGRVDWIDYAKRHRGSHPAAFAYDADERAGEAAVWLVWSDLYPPTQPTCRGLRTVLEQLRPAHSLLVEDRPARHPDHGALIWFGPSDLPRPPLLEFVESPPTAVGAR